MVIFKPTLEEKVHDCAYLENFFNTLGRGILKLTYLISLICFVFVLAFQ